MKEKQNHAKLNSKGYLEIHTDNGVFINGEIHTDVHNRMFEISGEDLMKIYGLLQDKEITCLFNFQDGYFGVRNNYMIVGDNVETKRIMELYTKLLDKVNKFNTSRRWWQRKIDVSQFIY